MNRRRVRNCWQRDFSKARVKFVALASSHTMQFGLQSWNPFRIGQSDWIDDGILLNSTLSSAPRLCSRVLLSRNRQWVQWNSRRGSRSRVEPRGHYIWRPLRRVVTWHYPSNISRSRKVRAGRFYDRFCLGSPLFQIHIPRRKKKKGEDKKFLYFRTRFALSGVRFWTQKGRRATLSV